METTSTPWSHLKWKPRVLLPTDSTGEETDERQKSFLDKCTTYLPTCLAPECPVRIALFRKHCVTKKEPSALRRRGHIKYTVNFSSSYFNKRRYNMLVLGTQESGLCCFNGGGACVFRDAILQTLDIAGGYLSCCCLCVVSSRSAHYDL